MHALFLLTPLILIMRLERARRWFEQGFRDEGMHVITATWKHVHELAERFPHPIVVEGFPHPMVIINMLEAVTRMPWDARDDEMCAAVDVPLAYCRTLTEGTRT